MRAFLKITFAATAIGLCAFPWPPAFAGDYGWHGPVCSADSFYACRYEPYGNRFCGCWQGGDRPACPSGYRFACLPAPNGQPYCACY